MMIFTSPYRLGEYHHDACSIFSYNPQCHPILYNYSLVPTNDAIKQNGSEVEKYDFCFFVLFCFLAFSIRVLVRLSFGENPTKIVQLVPNIQTVEGLNKQ